MHKEMMQIDQSPFCTLFAPFCAILYYVCAIESSYAFSKKVLFGGENNTPQILEKAHCN